MKRFLLFLLVCLAPAVVFADNSNGLTLTPQANDLSLQYLTTIFGVVDGVLHGTGSQLLGTMFGVFNSAIVLVAGVLVSYTYFVSVLNTAHDGEVLGRNWSSIWIPVRSITGVGLLIPQISGYSLAQVIVMWVVVQGIGAADSVWNAALGYLAKGGVVIQNSKSSGELGAASYVIKAGSILKNETCMFAVENSLRNTAQQQAANAPIGGATSPIAVVPSFLASLAVSGYNQNTNTYHTPINYNIDNYGVIFFPGDVNYPPNSTNMNYKGICGAVAWTVAIGGGNSIMNNSQPFNSIAKDPTRGLAVQQMVLDVQPLAQAFANILVPPVTAGGSVIPLTKTLPQVAQANKGQVAYTADDYIGIMGPALKQISTAQAADIRTTMAGMGDYGWILAGSYYYKLVQLNRTYASSNDSGNIMGLNGNAPNTGQSSFNPTYSGLFSTLNPTDQANIKNNLPVGDVATTCDPKSLKPIDAFICGDYSAQSSKSTTSGFSYSAAAAGGGDVASTLNDMISGIADTVVGLNNLLTAQGNTNKATTAEDAENADPIIQISSMGSSLLEVVMGLWIGGAVTIFVVALVASISQCVNPTGNAVLTMILWIIPMLTVIMSLLFVSGATMAYYVPLVPYLIYIFAAIGWLVAVIEAMVAAPLVALGIAHPEGHDFMGKGEPAIILLLSVFLRPSLMVFGFLAGAILSHVALWLLNTGLSSAIQSSTALDSTILNLFSVIALIMFYVGFVIAIINRSFALIHEIPSRVLRWIGGTMESYGEEQAVGDVKGQFAQQMQGVGEGFAKTTDAATKSAESAEAMGKSIGEKSKGGDAKIKGDDKGGSEGGTPPPETAAML